MSISIVTVTYNSSSYINQYLKSLDSQESISRLQLIIVDNNSKDQKLLKTKIKKFHFQNIKVKLTCRYLKVNQGFGISCNYGARLALYNKILFLNPDVKVMSKSLYTLQTHLKVNMADICGGKSIHMNTLRVHRTVFNSPSIDTMLFEFSNLGKILNISGKFYIDQNLIDQDVFVDGVSASYFLIKKSCFKQLSGFDENIFMYLEDVDICVRAKTMGMKILYCPHSTIKHIGGASSKNIYGVTFNAWYQSRAYYGKKHFSYPYTILFKAIYKAEELLLELRQKLLKP